MPGMYNVTQPNQPDRYRDGRESLGTIQAPLGVPAPVGFGLVAPDLVAGDDRDGEAFEGILLDSGFDALDYDFGELAITTSKTDFIRPIVYR
jgi:hypothetical protein